MIPKIQESRRREYPKGDATGQRRKQQTDLGLFTPEEKAKASLLHRMRGGLK